MVGVTSVASGQSDVVFRAHVRQGRSGAERRVVGVVVIEGKVTRKTTISAADVVVIVVAAAAVVKTARR